MASIVQSSFRLYSELSSNDLHMVSIAWSISISFPILLIFVGYTFPAYFKRYSTSFLECIRIPNSELGPHI